MGKKKRIIEKEREIREYIIGQGKMPAWCRKVIDIYQKMDNSIGYELRTHRRNVSLNKGDKIIKDNGLFRVERKKVVQCE